MAIINQRVERTKPGNYEKVITTVSVGNPKRPARTVEIIEYRVPKHQTYYVLVDGAEVQ